MIQINYLLDETPTFTLKSSTLSKEDTRNLLVNATFDPAFRSLSGLVKFKSSGNWDRVCEVDGKVSWIKFPKHC